MIRFLCPLCREIIASESWTPNEKVKCACCGKEVNAPESRFSPGAIIGDFLLVRRLGAGGMGIVFKAHQLSLDRPAAIKVLNPEFSKEADSVQAFIREARSAAKLNHPNIVQAYAVGEDEGIFYFAMEFIDGETMKETLQRVGKIEYREAAKAVMQVADGLDTAWKEQKLIHHDIKPDNIMQCSNQRYKLADLGLSQVFGEDADDDSNEVLGTPQYISPEQLTGVMTDTRSDIYSLGATFYHLVTGQFPYNGKDTDEIARQHVYGTLVPPNQVNPMLPAELNNIIVKMMEKDPASRFQNCGEVVKAIQDFLEGKHASSGLSGGLSGGLNSGLSGGLSGGMSGSTNAPTLNPGGNGATLRLGGTSQAKTLEPPSHPQVGLKISSAPAATAQPVAPNPSPVPQIKISLKPHPAPAETPEAEASAPTAETPAAEVVPAPVINLKRPAAEPPAPEAPQAEAPAPEPEPEAPQAEDPKREAPKAEEPKAEEPAPEPEAKDAKGKKGKKDKKAKKDAKPDAEKKDGEKSDADPKAEDAADKDKKDAKPEKSSSSITWLVVLGALVLCGALVAFSQMHKEPVKAPVASPKTEIKPVEIVIPDATIQEYANGAPVEPEKAPEPVLSEFERESKRLQELAMSNAQSFLSEWPSASASLMPDNEQDRETLAQLETTYINLDERLNLAPARESLLTEYKNAAAQKLQNDKLTALAAKVAAEDAKEEKRAAQSPQAYQEDLKRKVMLLDHAMIRAARSGKEEDWNAFNALIDKAFQEPKLYADDAQRKKIAEALALYANELATVADQGRAFTAFLESNKAGGHTMTLGKGSLTVESTTKDSITYSLTLADGTNDSGSINLRTDSPQKMRAIADTLGMAAGRSGQFFYYMVYNGFLKEDLRFAAPSTFWKTNVGHIIGNYFRRAIFVATDEELKALRDEFGEWQAFQWAEKKQP